MKHFSNLKDNLEKRISELQDELKELNPNNSLLKMIDVDHLGLKYSEEFRTKYHGEDVADSLSEYLLTLKSITNFYKFVNPPLLKELIEMYSDENSASIWLSKYVQVRFNLELSELLKKEDLDYFRQEVSDQLGRIEYGVYS